MHEFDYLTTLPGTPQEKEWLRARLEVLSVKESYILAAAMQRQPLQNAMDAVNCLCSLGEYEVYSPAGNDTELGESYMRYEIKHYERELPFVNLAVVGQMYQDKYPGQFIEDCYVIYPNRRPAEACDGNGTVLPPDNDWSVRLKLSSPTCREGVWVSLPDDSIVNDGRPGELALALKELGVQSVQECMLLDAKCSLPAAGTILEQYHDIADLVYDGNDLGFVLDEQGQGMPNFMEKFLGALKYEECDNLRFALDISQNLHCYEWGSLDRLVEVATEELLNSGMPIEFIHPECVDLEARSLDVLERMGGVMTDSGNGFVTRNDQEFTYERTVPKETEMTMG